MIKFLVFLGMMFSVIQSQTVSLDFVATQWTNTIPYGSVAMLAHNWSVGQYFDELENGDIVTTINSGGIEQDYIVIKRVEHTFGFNNEEVFNEIYVGKRLVLQTCTDSGLLFIIALPIQGLGYWRQSVK